MLIEVANIQSIIVDNNGWALNINNAAKLYRLFFNGTSISDIQLTVELSAIGSSNGGTLVM